MRFTAVQGLSVWNFVFKIYFVEKQFLETMTKEKSFLKTQEKLYSQLLLDRIPRHIV